MPLLFKTKQERARDEFKRRQRKAKKEAERECDYFAALIPKVLANSGIDHWLPRPDRPTVGESIITGASARQKVKILETRWNEHAIYLWLDTRELPYRTDLTHLHTDAILETLSAACGRQVAWKSEPGKGSWYVVWRNGAINAIPIHYAYKDAVAAIPQNAGPLYFIAGVAENNSLIRGDLAQMPHYLVAGSTGAGKSVHLNSMLCQMITRNTPDTLQLLMIDLKNGSEFAFYENVPHLIRPIIKRPEHVLDAIKEFYEEMERRSELFAASHVKNILGYNDKYPDEKLPYMVMVFDEAALVLNGTNKKLKDEIEPLLSDILARSRSSGGHCVLCTQTPRSGVVTPYIKINCSTRICFAVPGNHDSMAVIDCGDAARLSTAGRAIYLHGSDLTEIQSPYISDEHIDKIVREVIARGGGLAPKNPDEVTLMDLIEESINNYGGKLHTARLYKSFAGKVGRDRINAMIKEIDGTIVPFQGRRYQVVNQGKGIHGGRMLKPLDPEPEASNQPRLELVIANIKPQSPHSILKPKPNPDARKVS